MNDWFDAEQRIERALELSESRRWVEALAEIDAALEINPSNSSWLSHRGFLLDQLGRYVEAIEAYEQALEIEEDDRDLLFALATGYMNDCRMMQALDTLLRLTALYPDFEPGFCQQIIVYAELGQHDKAEEAFYLAQQIKDDCPHCFFNIGLSLADEGAHQRALRCWERVLEIDPEYEEVQGQMARAYRAIGELERAKELFLTEWRNDPGNVDLLCEFGELLVHMGDAKAGAAKFTHAIELSPDHVEAHAALADTLLLSGQAEQASKILERIGEIDKDRSGVAAKLGLAYLALSRFQVAREHLELALEESPSEATTLLALGNCLLHLGKPIEAAERFRRVIAVDGNRAAAFHSLGTCCLLTGDHDLAIEHCRRAIELTPEDPAPLVKLALAFLALGRFREAREAIDAGLKLEPHHDSLTQLSARFWRYRVGHLFGWLRSIFRRSS